MAKGAVGLVAGYWPEDVYRYLAVPGLSLEDGVVLRPARKQADRIALAAASEAVTYGQMAQDMERCASLLRQALSEGQHRIALVVPGQVDVVRLLFGSLRARCTCALLDPHLPEPALARQLDAFRADVVIAAGEPGACLCGQGQDGRRVILAEELLAGAAGGAAQPSRSDLKAPAVALPGPGQRLVYHSHATLLAWAVSWSAFLTLTEADVFLSLEPVHRWAGLMTALAVMFRGGTCVMAGAHSPNELASQVQKHRPRYLLMRFADALASVRANPRPLARELSQTVEGIFAALEQPFRVKERRQIESAFEVPVLTVLGNAASGPAVAAHPSWYLDESAGIPITNVDLWPLHPATGQPLAVPWEAVDYAQLGVRSPLVAVDHETEDDRAEWVRDGWLRMDLTALMDPSGLFYLRPWR